MERKSPVELKSLVELKDAQLDAVAAGALVHANNVRLMNNAQLKKNTTDVTGTVDANVG
jgi:hypothetical protein